MCLVNEENRNFAKTSTWAECSGWPNWPIVTHLPYPPQCRTHSLFPLHLSYVTLSNALCPLFSALRQFSINSLLSPQILKTMVRKEHPLAGFGDGNRWFIKKIYFFTSEYLYKPDAKRGNTCFRVKSGVMVQVQRGGLSYIAQPRRPSDSA